jgi:16S rRNA G527 N7-methylase RsmG
MSPEEFAKAFDVSRETISRLQAYHDLLVKWQKAINIVSPKTLDEVWSRHFADSAQLAERIPQNAKVADLGSGGGFPGLVLAIMRPDLEIHLVESDLRKSEFLKNVSRETKSAARVHNDRVESVLASIGPGHYYGAGVRAAGRNSGDDEVRSGRSAIAFKGEDGLRRSGGGAEEIHF